MPSLHQRLTDRLAAAPDHRLSFAEVMELALYDPDHGYYGRGPRKLGRSGDFFTSVSVGPLFGQLLAGFASAAVGSTDYEVIEQGAHDGQLAEDVLFALPATVPYCVVEPSEAHRAVQERRLRPKFGDRVRWVDSLEALRETPQQAVYLCNELPDAFPVHVVRWTGTEWLERWVTADPGGGFRWTDAPLSSEALIREVSLLPTDLAAGFTTEIHLAMIEWVRALSQTAFTGPVVIADYGLDSEEFFDSSRCDGTLRRYRDHQTDDRILEDLGDCDLTSHVPFTRLIAEAERCGMSVTAYEDQGRWLTRVAEPWLRSLEGQPPDAQTRAMIRQFQTLTHPQFLGRSFRVLVLAKRFGR